MVNEGVSADFKTCYHSKQVIKTFIDVGIGGTRTGSGMVVLFLVTGTTGFVLSLLSFKSPVYKELNM